MKKLYEYIEHANECREMARAALPQHRAQLEQMAVTWEQLADARKRQLPKQDQSAKDGSGAADP